MTDKTIVITRPKGDEQILRDELQELGHRVIHEPLTDIFLHHTERTQLQHALLDDPDAVIVTSRHGVNALALLTELRDIFLLCVGEATAQTAMALGFERVSVAGGNVDRMIDYIMDGYDEDARFLYVCGEHTAADLEGILGVRGMQVQTIVGYDAEAATALSDTLTLQLQRGQIDAITFMSARSAEIFIALAKKAGVAETLNKLDAFALSATIADMLTEANFRTVFIADEPTLASLVACVDNAYGNNENFYV